MYVAQSLQHQANQLIVSLRQLHSSHSFIRLGIERIRAAAGISLSVQQQLQLAASASTHAQGLGRHVRDNNQSSQVFLLQRQELSSGHELRQCHAGSSRLWHNQPGMQPTTSYSSSAVHAVQDASDLDTPSKASSHNQVEEQHSSQGQASAQALVLDGKAVAAEWSAELQHQVTPIAAALGRAPSLAVVLVGNRPDSLLYVARKQEACQRIGIHCQVMHLPDTIRQSTLQEAVRQLAHDPAVDGMLVQLPLPRHLDEERVMEFLDPRKDVDGFHPLNMGRMLMRGRARRFIPATPLGVVELLSRSGVSVSGKTAVVLGDSNIVGTPLAALLRDEGAALVTTCHRVSYQEWYDQAASRLRRAQAEVCLPRLPGPASAAERHRQQADSRATSVISGGSGKHAAAGSRFQASQLPDICRTADLLVVAVGSPELVKSDWVKPGAVVVDVGINVVPLGPSSSSGLESSQQPCIQQPGHERGAQHCHQSHSSFQLAQGSMSESDCGVGFSASSISSSLSEVGSLSDGRYAVVGDVAHDEVARVASVLTPVPGGVGPMTIAAVLHNTLQAARCTVGMLGW